MIKVRHPNIIDKLKMDLKLIFSITNAISKFPGKYFIHYLLINIGFKWMELPIT